MPAAFVISLLAAVVFTPLTILLARRTGACDRPSSGKLHGRVTPLLGGLSVLAAAAFASWTVGVDWRVLEPLCVGMGLIALIGLVDDVRPLRPSLKMGAMIPAGIIPILLWPAETPPLWWAAPLFMIGFVCVTNAVNLLDTMDGLTGLMTGISATAFGLMLVFAGHTDLGVAALAIAGACIGFLFFNWRFIHPALIFLGDMGALALGAGLFVLAAHLAQSVASVLDYAAIALPVALVVINTPLTMAIRLRKGLGPLSRSKDHISERLYMRGVPRWEITAWLGLVNLIAAAAGVIAWLAVSPVIEAVVIVVGIAPVLYLAWYSTKLELPAEGTPPFVPRRVCRIITRLNVGGPSQQCVYLTKTLRDLGWETYLITGVVDTTTEDSMECLAEQEGVEFIRVPAMGADPNPITDLRALWQTYLVLRRLRPQIVHTHHAKAGTIGRLAAALTNTPIIVHTHHGISLIDYFGPVKNTIFLTIERFAASVATVLIAIGENDRADLIRLRVAPPERFVVIPLGLPLERLADPGLIRGELRARLSITNDTRLIVYAGRLVPIKDIPVLIRATAELVKQRPDVHVALFGDGPLRSELEDLAKELGVADAITFCGTTHHLETAYADADLVALCSKREGMPVVIMEAMAAGRPVLSTDVGNVRSLITDGVTGRLVPSGDSEALAAAMLAALDDPEHSMAMARAGQQHVLSAFSIETLTQRINALYEAQIAGDAYCDPQAIAQVEQAAGPADRS